MTTDPGPARALILDFNGTVSHDEHIVLELFQELFAEHGRPLDAATYERQLAGMSDPEIVWAWLGRDHPAAPAVVAERDRRYRARTADGSTIPAQVREAVRLAAEHVPVAICSGAARAEIEATLAAAGIAGSIDLIVAAEDVARGKPAPDGYLAAHRLLAPELPAADVLVFEDTEVGVISALAAGLRCIAVLGTMRADRLRAAERVVRELEPRIVREALGLPV
ncbi:MAG TPA: HAD family phosphatase [Gaiellales bacterium]|nr:HAD family phosphatase [Gaiellales bacterium]